MHRGLAILTRPGARSRRGEVDGVRAAVSLSLSVFTAVSDALGLAAYSMALSMLACVSHAFAPSAPRTWKVIEALVLKLLVNS